MKTLPEPDRARATGFFTAIRRRGREGGKPGFAIVPYSVEYQGELARAAELLREAAALTTQPTLKAFLTQRARTRSSRTTTTRATWRGWSSTRASSPRSGPYEVYEDEWFNAKAGFEAFIAVRDDAETAKLAKFGAELQDIEDHLPIDPKLPQPEARRRWRRSASST